MQYLHQFSFCILFIMVIYCFKYGFLQFQPRLLKNLLTLQLSTGC